MYERGASKLRSLFSLEPVAQTGFTSMKVWPGPCVWPTVPGTKPQEHFQAIASNGAIPSSPAHPRLAPCPKPNALEPCLLRSRRHQCWHQPLP